MSIVTAVSRLAGCVVRLWVTQVETDRSGKAGAFQLCGVAVEFHDPTFYTERKNPFAKRANFLCDMASEKEGWAKADRR